MRVWLLFCGSMLLMGIGSCSRRVHEPLAIAPPPLPVVVPPGMTREIPPPPVQYTTVKVNTLEENQHELLKKIYVYHDVNALTFKNIDSQYEKLMQRFEVSPEDSEKMRSFKQLHKQLDQVFREKGLTEEQIRRFYVLNYLEAQVSD